MESVLRVVFFACLEYIASFLFLLLSSPKWRTLSYYYALVRRRASRRARFDIFKVDLKATPKESGQLAQDVEWELEKPSKKAGVQEKVFFHGSNSNGDVFIMEINWQPASGKLSGIISAKLIYKHNGYVYKFEESDSCSPFVECPEDTYRIKGLSVQVVAPFRKSRIIFRGLISRKRLSDGDVEDVFLRLRLFWNPLTKVYDSLSDYNDDFMARELATGRHARKRNFDAIYEDYYEQYSQLKGTLQVESRTVEEVFLWGGRSKSSRQIDGARNTTAIRLLAFSKKGMALSLGAVTNRDANITYRYGSTFLITTLFSTMSATSLSEDDLRAFMACDLTKKRFSVGSEGQKAIDVEIINLAPLAEGIAFGAATFNGKKQANCLIINDSWSDSKANVGRLGSPRLALRLDEKPSSSEANDFIYSISDVLARKSDLTGGKGSSLAVLSALSDHMKRLPGKQPLFEVPQGVIVNTNAYAYLLSNSKDLRESVDSLQKTVWANKVKTGLADDCRRVREKMGTHPLPESIRSQIERALSREFAASSDATREATAWRSALFSVRSSACGEDSEEMSAAGQMTTFLGVKGLDNICAAVMQCWASQFDAIPVEYKRGYGQLINAPMAVVIQQIVHCDAAGVMFTCDPLSGDEREIILTANYGLGESVVSASAEPDTVTLSVDLRQRLITRIKKIEVGAKKSSIKVAIDCEDGGTREASVEPNDSIRCCLENASAIDLGEIGLMISELWKGPRDIEWGIKDGRIYLLQSRPVTNLDRLTEWELMHEMDTGQASELEFVSRANVGEVMPGAMSHHANTYAISAWNLPGFLRTKNLIGLQNKHYCPYFLAFFCVCYNQIFFNLKNRAFRIGDPKNSGKAMMIGIFGHELDDEDLLRECREIFEDMPDTSSKLSQVMKIAFLVRDMFFSGILFRRTVASYEGFKLFKEGQTFDSSAELFDYLINETHHSYYGMLRHSTNTTVSSIWNVILISILSKSDPNNPDVYSDLAYLLSNCNQVVSAEVPNAVRDVAASIGDANKFRGLSDDEALEYLLNGDENTSSKFRSLLNKHGHRGYKEFDPAVKQWAQNPLPLVKSLKTMLAGDIKAFRTKAQVPDDEVINNLKTKLTPSGKFLLKHLVLPWSRSSVGMREQSKSFMVWLVDVYRQGFQRLADMMAYEEGRLPDPELLFFLTIEELSRLVRVRDPLLVARAKQRRRAFPVMDKFRFDEIARGPDLRPRNVSLRETEIKKALLLITRIVGLTQEQKPRNADSLTGQKTVEMKGVPVCAGKIEARICVAHSLEDALNIQPGDILITYSTDIGWSPYFPMLGGLATEIGGLISHGAVIAREYGLPCIIGIDGASNLFRTGDIAYLDAEKGVITKIG